jgi:hypothetical protein
VTLGEDVHSSESGDGDSDEDGELPGKSAEEEKKSSSSDESYEEPKIKDEDGKNDEQETPNDKEGSEGR